MSIDTYIGGDPRTWPPDRFVPNRMLLPCAALAIFDDGAGYGFRCMQCGAVVGSIGQPQSCKDEAEKWANLEAMGGKGWDYRVGQQKE